MVNIGIDFGSTYTMVSVLENGHLKTVQPDAISHSYPSVVAYDEKKKIYYFGTAARTRLGKANVRGFRGFKMLLNEQMSPENLIARGYDEINTPEYVTEIFLKFVVEKTLSNLGENEVGMLVLGAPECWFGNVNTVDARESLRKICEKLEMVKNIRIVSEPTNAAAMCVWDYIHEKKKKIEGNILVVDYGGGTLDTTVVNVEHMQDDKFQIRSLSNKGAGENTDREIGKAGIAYQEAVLRKAISEQLGIAEESIECDSNFDSAVKEFENFLISSADDIDFEFESNIATPSALVDNECISVDYKKECISITYDQMIRAYDETIRDVLDTVLRETSNDIMPNTKIYLGLVGGFSKFFLVRKQINDFFGNGFLISEENNIVTRDDMRDVAIAHGAAIFAEDAIKLCNVAHFGIGMYVYFNGTNEVFRNYAIEYMQEYEPNKIYTAKDCDGNEAPMFLPTIDTFLINFEKNPMSGFSMKPKKSFATKLNAVKRSPVVVVGFSIDNMERICVHIYNYTLNVGRDPEPIQSIPLSTVRECFNGVVLL